MGERSGGRGKRGGRGRSVAGRGTKGNESGGKGRWRGRTYLDKPANKVTRYKHIHLVHYVCKGAIGVARSIDAAVLSIGALW